MNRRGSLLQQVLLLVLIIGIAACAQISLPSSTSATPTIDPAHLTAFAHAQSQFTPSPIPTATPTPIPPLLGPVPHDCPPGPTPQPTLPGIGPVIGGSVVWAEGFGGPHAVIDISGEDTYTQYGWTWKIIWEVGPNYTHLVTLDGANLQSGARVWFQIGDQDPTVSPILDPQHPGHPGSVVGGDWAEWGSYIFVPTAGCYYLEASWPGGHWRITFAFGRQ